MEPMLETAATPSRKLRFPLGAVLLSIYFFIVPILFLLFVDMGSEARTVSLGYIHIVIVTPALCALLLPVFLRRRGTLLAAELAAAAVAALAGAVVLAFRCAIEGAPVGETVAMCVALLLLAVSLWAVFLLLLAESFGKLGEVEKRVLTYLFYACYALMLVVRVTAELLPLWQGADRTLVFLSVIGALGMYLCVLLVLLWILDPMPRVSAWARLLSKDKDA